MTPERIKEIEDLWLQVCGPHDYGIYNYNGCACPPSDADPRSVILELVREVERLQEAAK